MFFVLRYANGLLLLLRLHIGFSNQFDKYSWKTIDDLGKDYDYRSIMHYDRTAFTKNGLPTIVNMFDEAMEFGTPERSLSQKDIIEINALYDCSTSKWLIVLICNKTSLIKKPQISICLYLLI